MRHHHVVVTGDDSKSFRGESADCWICPAIEVDYELLQRQIKKIHCLMDKSKLPQPLLNGIAKLLCDILNQRPFREKET